MTPLITVPAPGPTADPATPAAASTADVVAEPCPASTHASAPSSVPARRRPGRRTRRVLGRGSSGPRDLRRLAEAGMTTAEYAVGTIAACTFAAVLIAIARSPEIRAALIGVITRAIGLGA